MDSPKSSRLSTADRKRQTDRKAQRQRRERIKTYIARLEKTLEDLTASSGNGMEATLLKQLEQQRAKTERLTNVITHIHEVLEENRGDGLGDGDEMEEGGLNGAVRPPGSSSGSSLGSGAGSGSGSSRRRSQPSLQNPSNTAPDTNTKPTPQTFISADLGTRISLHSQNPSNSGTRNYFGIVNESISNVSKEQNSLMPSTTADDDDLAIRAILFGWGSVRQSQNGKGLDRVWGLLQALDQAIFSETGLVERVAVLRLMRAMIKWNVSPREHTIPSFMFPTVTQSMIPHAPIIDFFAWPNLRDHLIVSGITNIPETTASLYISQIRLKWPYELRDICRLNVSENKYRFSSEFDSVYYDLQCWSIGSPQLQSLIEAGPAISGFDSGTGCLGVQGDEDGGYWERLLDVCDSM